jgi:2-keto-3-deoxy-6-phosphogluconate aldolase
MICTSTAVDALEARLRRARIIPVVRVGDPDVARGVLQAAGVPLVEGGLTPTELLDATSRGIAKLFPAHVVGVRYLRSLLAVAPEARIEKALAT